MNARLVCPVGTLAGKIFEIGREAVVGRKSPEAGNALVLEDERVSGKHARIRWEAAEGCYYLEDLGSTNGTFVAGSRVRAPERLLQLDVINFGGAYDFVFQILPEAGEPVSSEAKEDEAKTNFDAGPLPLPPISPGRGLGGSGETTVAEGWEAGERTVREDGPPVLPRIPPEPDRPPPR